MVAKRKSGKNFECSYEIVLIASQIRGLLSTTRP